MSETVLGKRPATEGQIQELLAAGLKDPEARVRRDAVGILGTIRFMSSLPQIPPGQKWAVRLHAVADALWPEVEKAADDPDDGVRLEALRAIGRVHTPTQSPEGLPRSVVELFAAKYERDPSTQVRALIVTALTASHKSSDTAVRAIAHRILLRALAETDPYVVQAAGQSAWESKSLEALPLLVNQLKNPSHIARMGAAIGLQAYPKAAKPFLPQMEEALSREAEGPTKKTLEAAIRLVRESK